MHTDPQNVIIRLYKQSNFWDRGMIVSLMLSSFKVADLPNSQHLVISDVKMKTVYLFKTHAAIWALSQLYLCLPLSIGSQYRMDKLGKNALCAAAKLEMC